MIDKATWLKLWERLCRRFNRELDSEEALGYKAYLEQQGLTTEDVVASGTVLWATREFFPRPADFLLVRAAEAWPQVLRAVSEHRPPELSGWKYLPLHDARAKTTVLALGGLPALKESYNRDPMRTRMEFMRAYESEVMRASMAAAVDALCAPNEPAKLAR